MPEWKDVPQTKTPAPAPSGCVSMIILLGLVVFFVGPANVVAWGKGQWHSFFPQQSTHEVSGRSVTFSRGEGKYLLYAADSTVLLQCKVDAATYDRDGPDSTYVASRDLWIPKWIRETCDWTKRD